MRPDQERVRNLLTDTVTLLCKNGLQYQKELRVQGLLGITLDDSDVFVVHINETFGDLIGGAISLHTGDDDSEQLALEDAEPPLCGKINTHTSARKLKQRRRSDDTSESSADVGTIGQPAPLRSLKRSTSTSSYALQNNTADTTAEKDGNDGRVPAANADHIDLNVKVKTEDDVMIIDDKGSIQSCDAAGTGSLDISHSADAPYSGLALGGSNYQQFDRLIGMMSDMSGDPGGGEPTSKRRLTQDHYSTVPSSTQDRMLHEGGPFVTGIIRNETGALGTATTTDSAWDSTQASFSDSGMADAMPGCSTWSPAVSSGRLTTGQADPTSESAMLLSRKYPPKQLRGPAIKEMIVSKIVSPVMQNGDHVSAFRIVWRLKKELQHDAWLTIVNQREICDSIVLQAPGVQFFVSSVTGVYTKGNGGSTQPKPVYPGVSYWIAKDSEMDPLTFLMPQLQSVSPEAELKLISFKTRHDDVGLFSAPLFVVLKDHNSVYVKGRLYESLNHLGLPISTVSMLPAKLTIFRGSRYSQQITEACDEFQNVGLLMHVQEVGKMEII